MDISRITDTLYVGTTPAEADFGTLQELGIGLVINMRMLWGHAPNARYPALKYLRIRTFDHPLLLIPFSALERGAKAALPTMENGGGVFVHCARGRHRSVAMAAAILIAQRYTPEAAIQLIKQQRPQADPEAFHIRPRIVGFSKIWNRPT